MEKWLDRPGSLNWANRKKLYKQIKELDQTINSLKDAIFDLLSLVKNWSDNSKKLLELDIKNQLTANHILHLTPLNERIQNFKLGLDKLADIYKTELTELKNENSPKDNNHSF